MYEPLKAYVFGRPFVIKSDYRALVDILSTVKVKNTTARLARLATKL